MKQSGRRILMINFAGLGNGIWVVPILQRLEAAADIGAYFHTSNPIFSASIMMDWLGFRKFAGTVPSAWRRFDRQVWGDIVGFLQSQDIDLIINLRNEGPFRDIGYFQFKKDNAGLGVEFWDLDQAAIASRGKQRSLFADQIELFQKSGVDLQQVNRTWVRDYVSHAQREGVRHAAVGFFTGASQNVKRWSAQKWIQLGRRVLQETDRKVIVYAGQTPEEVSDAREVVVELSAGFGGGRCTLVMSETFEYLCEHMAGLDVLVSNDTFSVHLAVALDVPVVGLYFSTDSSIWGGIGKSFVGVQSRTGLLCPQFKPDAGNCAAFYGGCPGPCKEDVTPQGLYPLIHQVLQSSSVRPKTCGCTTVLSGPSEGDLASCLTP